MVCAWDHNKVCLALRRAQSRRVIETRQVCWTRLPLYIHLKMDSDEEMQIDSEIPSFPSLAKGKGKAVFRDEPEDPAGGRDDTLPWYMESLSCSR